MRGSEECGDFHGCVKAGQNRTDLSSLALARRFPSGLKQTPATNPECPLRVRAGCPVRLSQTLTVWSLPQVAMRLPSWLKLTLLTLFVCPFRVRVS